MPNTQHSSSQQGYHDLVIRESPASNISKPESSSMAEKEMKADMPSVDEQHPVWWYYNPHRIALDHRRSTTRDRYGKRVDSWLNIPGRAEVAWKWEGSTIHPAHENLKNRVRAIQPPSDFQGFGLYKNGQHDEAHLYQSLQEAVLCITTKHRNEVEKEKKHSTASDVIEI